MIRPGMRVMCERTRRQGDVLQCYGGRCLVMWDDAYKIEPALPENLRSLED